MAPRTLLLAREAADAGTSVIVGVPRAVARGAAVGALGFVVLGLVPLGAGPLRATDVVLFAVGLVFVTAGIVGAAVRERRSALAGDEVSVQRIEHVIVLVLWAIALFSIVYARLAAVPDEFVGLATRLDAAYFAVTTLTTVGFGDIHAAGQVARAVVLVQMVFNVVVIAVAVRVIAAAVRRRGEPR